MTQLSGQERASYVQSMFTKIAHRYDVMNRLMTGGMDVRWRKEVISLTKIRPHGSILDLGTGTGDLAREALTQYPKARVTAADFTLEMMRVGKKSGPLNFSSADALHLPFLDKTFDAVVSGFLMRNVTDVQVALQEQYRVLKPGGRIVVLDTTKPKKNLLSPFIKFHMHVIIPTIGGLLSGMRDAYEYLPDSTEGFLTAEELLIRMAAVGFRRVQFKRLMFGTIAIHWGEK
ncbi:MAG TPA: ubiquinone/menaquinone biosynthesis methyltransferase [Anaerolineales bacterium]|nr:ubiquinone/menaquinone biosynthesis methyltransferase [Anaerolineales bacterium]HNB37025.1 ubiquinone/menaquinone biosynthesis methyltransferase [Anaerolineales bacterium]